MVHWGAHDCYLKGLEQDALADCLVKGKCEMSSVKDS